MRIEFLYWEECPSHEEAWQRLTRVLAEENVGGAVDRTHVGTDEQARALGFPGSPTIRVNGRDIQPPPPETGGSLTCRLYMLEDGRPSPLPSSEMIRGAVRAADATSRTSESLRRP